MKNKVVKLLLIFIMSIMMFVTVTKSSNNVVKAETTYHDFSEFNFVIGPNIDLTGEASWTVRITWKALQEIKYLEVMMFLEDGHEELVYIDGRENLAQKTVIEEEDGYRYILEFDINSSSNLQGIELRFKYSYLEEIPNKNELTTKTYLLSTGNTNLPDKIKFGSYLLIGLIASLCAAGSTFIIVQNTKKEFLKIKENDNMEDIDNEQLSN